MDGELPRPKLDHVSTLAALVLLAYTLVRIVDLPTLSAGTSVFGLAVRLTIDTRLIMLSLAAALAVVGADSLVRSHPQGKPSEPALLHWIIPGLAALGVGGILTRLPEGPLLWLGLAAGAGLLIAVFVAEYLVVDRGDPRHDTAAFGLRSLAILLLLQSFFVIRGTGMRAIYALPLIFLAGTLVSWRLISLSQDISDLWPYPLVTGSLLGQLAAGLHYWPIDPLRESLLLVLGFYLADNLTSRIAGRTLSRGALLELAVVGGVGLAAVVLVS